MTKVKELSTTNNNYYWYLHTKTWWKESIVMVNNSINWQYKKNRTTTSHFKWLDTKKIMSYGSGKSGPDLVQAHKCGRAKTVNWTHTLFFDNWISNCNTDVW